MALALPSQKAMPGKFGALRDKIAATTFDASASQMASGKSVDPSKYKTKNLKSPTGGV